MLNSKVLRLIAESQTEIVKIKYKPRKCPPLLRSEMSSPNLLSCLHMTQCFCRLSGWNCAL